MPKHRFVDDGTAPIVIGGEVSCICGLRGGYQDVERHIEAHAQTDVIPTGDDFGGGDTKAHYLPNEPREPAPSSTPPETTSALPCRSRGCLAPLNSYGTCTVHYRDVLPDVDLPSDPEGPVERPSPPELPPPPPMRPRSIAEMFQDTLRQAFAAGAASVAVGETFETWYQREVLQ